jgi:mitochondrial glycoprotein family protein (MAM33)
MTCRGWEVANEYGSSVVSLSKQISDDEDVFISFKADMQSDISVPEDVAFPAQINA